MRNNVDLPDPFGPTTATHSPEDIVALSPSNTGREPNFLPTLSSSSIALNPRTNADVQLPAAKIRGVKRKPAIRLRDWIRADASRMRIAATAGR